MDVCEKEERTCLLYLIQIFAPSRIFTQISMILFDAIIISLPYLNSLIILSIISWVLLKIETSSMTKIKLHSGNILLISNNNKSLPTYISTYQKSLPLIVSNNFEEEKNEK